MRKRWFGLAAAVLTLGPVVALAPPRTRNRPASALDDLVAQCLTSGHRGRELVTEAIQTVAQEFEHHSVWHLWESPAQALAGRRGWSQQYNTVLLEVLRRLGFEARLVHAARVRGFGYPWWLSGHAWVKVRIGSQELDACASRGTNRAGECGFVPLTMELPVRLVTRWAVSLALTPFVAREVWAAWLTGRPVPAFVYSPRPGIKP